jgi:tetratricopeptide (TPR) repeat protein
MPQKSLRSIQATKTAVLFLIALVTIICHTPSASSAAPQESTRSFVAKRVRNFNAWLNAPWTDSDVIYRDLRSMIDIDLTKSSNPAIIVQRYEDQFRRNSTDPKALFAFVYCAFKASEIPNGISKMQFESKFDDLYTSISNAKIQAPQTYNYARLVFLGSAPYNDPTLINIGKRLLKQSPNDDEVEYALATVLTFSKVPADRNLAINYQQDLAKRFPNDSRTYRLLGIINYRTAWLNHSQMDADKSIAAYQRALDLSPQSGTTRSEYKTIIKFIRNLQAQWKQSG